MLSINPPEATKSAIINKHHAKIHNEICHEHRERGAEIIRTACPFVHREDSDEGDEQLDKEVLERVRH